MKIRENLKNRILMIVAAIAAYIFSPVLIGTPLFAVLSPVEFPLMGFFVHGIQVLVFLVLLYGAFEWIKPSLIPQSIPKKIIGIIIGVIIVLSVLPTGALTLEPTGVCSITSHAQEGKIVSSSNDQSTEQQCIDDCIRSGDRSDGFDQVSCKFSGIGESWVKTPGELQGYKPKI